MSEKLDGSVGLIYLPSLSRKAGSRHPRLENDLFMAAAMVFKSIRHSLIRLSLAIRRLVAFRGPVALSGA